MSYLEFEAGNTVISGGKLSRRTQLYEVEVTVVNVANRSNELSQIYTICNISVCVSVCLSVCLSVRLQ